ncbi:MAG: hypothetical protein Q8R16_04220, partial [bacterium]|nr:hypothetical protein [bacterium]
MATKKMLSLALVTAILQKIGEWIKTEPEEIPAGTITKEIMRFVLGSKSLPPAIDKGFEMILRSRWTKDRPGQEEIFSALRTITVPLDSWIKLVMDRKEACDDGNRMATEAELSGMAFGRIDGMNMVELQKIG